MGLVRESRIPVTDFDGSPGHLLREADFLDGGILSTIHHDFKNDLNLLTNYSEHLDSDDPGANIVHVVSKKFTASLNALLIGQRLSSGSLKSTPEELDPVRRVEQRVEWFRPLYEHVSRELTVSVEKPLESLRTDRQFFRLIVDSLLVLCSQKPEGQTELTLSETTNTAAAGCSLLLRQSNPPWRVQRTREVVETLRRGSLQELFSDFSARAGLFLFTVWGLLETQEGTLDIESPGDDRVLLQAILPTMKPASG